MTAVPRPTPPYKGTIGRLTEDCVPDPIVLDSAPEDAPNVVLVLLDDVGFGSFGAFGGPVPAPGLERVAAEGLRFNRFHTTAICAPTRASMLTGRNHHTVHMGRITEAANGFPAYDSIIPREAATVAEVLRQNGYTTGMFGKGHLTPSWETGPAGPFDRWPTGLGFDRFYGFPGAETSQFEPDLYDQTTPIAPYEGRDDYHLTEDMADKAIEWMQRVKAHRPDKPFLCYFSPGAVHTPLQVPDAWLDRFSGFFDEGWDDLRQSIFERQLEMGVIPSGTVNTSRPDVVPSWDEYPDRYKPVARRLMEVFAAFLAHTDAQVARLIDALEGIGEWENTLFIYVTGDNGASAEGRIDGTWSLPALQNGFEEDPEFLLQHINDFGTEHSECHYNVGWAWALDAPFQWMKQVASHFGGTRNGLAVSWPRRITDAGAIRDQFHHVIDLAPTILAAAGIEPPTSVNGIDQMPIEGQSMLASFTDPGVEGRRTQYFEMMGNRGIYHEGFMASCFHGRLPWIRFGSVPFDGPQESWELYDLREDFSQSHDLADERPELLAEMRDLFDAECLRNGVYPLRDAAMNLDPAMRAPSVPVGVTRMTYTTAHVRMPERVVLNIKNRSYRITCDLEVPEGTPEGVIVCQGGSFNGWAIYLDEGRPTWHYNLYGHVRTTVAAVEPLAPGRREVALLFDSDGGFGAGGTATLAVDGQVVGQARLEQTVPVVFAMGGESFDVGTDTGSPVGPYPHGFTCTATIGSVTVELLSEVDETTRTAVAAGIFHAESVAQ
ncbi:MAG: arylsulfatase [Acidimicrobiales bacterium]|jgi:arylsulfatase|nr:arylsulfatase [Actinomycetes bacterium]MDP6159935.1 arylsulfatase [Acidimicrobiales bacterium]MDP6286805.1 arylsulfatase [Acidimicrobiales bacterium]MDP6911401.1 arylsulfatase [Acidimicrobiales bacterium]HJM72254.1 arylsulfatase [Acidimicrobiales bacterium]